MIKSTAQADAKLRDLAERLQRKIEGSASIDTVRELRDADGWPMLILSDAANEAAGQPVIGIRMKGIDGVSKDVFNNDIVAYTPHSMEVAYELTAGGASTPSSLDISEVIAACAKSGVKLDIKEVANTVAVDEAGMDATAVAKEIEVQDEWPTKGA